MSAFCLQRDKNRHNLTDVQTDRQTGQLTRDHHDLFSLFGLDSPGIRSECLEDHLTPSVIVQPSPALDLNASSCRGRSFEPVAFTGYRQNHVRDL